MFMDEFTTIALRKTTVDRLNRTGYAGQSKDELVTKMLDFWDKVNKK